MNSAEIRRLRVVIDALKDEAITECPSTVMFVCNGLLIYPRDILNIFDILNYALSDDEQN